MGVGKHQRRKRMKVLAASGIKDVDRVVFGVLGGGKKKIDPRATSSENVSPPTGCSHFALPVPPREEIHLFRTSFPDDDRCRPFSLHPLAILWGWARTAERVFHPRG